MKTKVTKKEIKNNYGTILKVGYCDLQRLLKHQEAFAYSARSEGWACDYYMVNGVIISTGYDPIGQKVGYDIIKKYENMAYDIEYSNLDYNTEVEKINNLLLEFIQEVVN